jgi:6-hydroxynicotinate 3-monooxygenase
MDRATRIAILGAGLADLTTAGLLQRAGFSVAVYEQSPSFSRIGAGIILGANVAKVLRRLDLERRLTATGIRPDTFLSRAWDTGETTYQLVFDAACEARFDGMYGDLQGIAPPQGGHPPHQLAPSPLLVGVYPNVGRDLPRSFVW